MNGGGPANPTAFDSAQVASPPAPGGETEYQPRAGGLRFIRISAILLLIILALVGVSKYIGIDLYAFEAVIDEIRRDELPADGRSNLNGGAAALTYSAGPGLKEMITDEHWNEGPNDGARWELRSPITQGYNTISLAHYIFVPRLDNDAAITNFVAGKDREHTSLADGKPVTKEELVVGGRKGYVWTHEGRDGYWFYSAWFPQPEHTVRFECIAKKQRVRFETLCAEALKSLVFTK